MISIVPVADEEEEFSIRGGVRQRDDDAVVDLEAAIATRSFLEPGAGEVEVRPDLILHLEVVGEVSARRNGTVRTTHSVLPRSSPLPDPIPAKFERKPKNLASISQGPNEVYIEFVAVFEVYKPCD